MKKLLLAGFLTATFFISRAQESTLVPDQNPNYKLSLDKYKSSQEKLQANMNTTVQDTYKAYDWYEAKQERKVQRRADRQERRLYALQNYGNYFNPYNNYYDPFQAPYRYSPYGYRFNHRRW